MSMTITKVFGLWNPRAPQEVFDVSHKMNCDFHCNGNDSYYELEIVKAPSGDDQGCGWVSTVEIRLLTKWLIEQGAEIGETVLISHNW